MDITIEAKSVSISSDNYNKVVVNLEYIDKGDLDNIDVAKCISMGTFLEAYDNDEILKYLGTNYLKLYLEGLV